MRRGFSTAAMTLSLLVALAAPAALAGTARDTVAVNWHAQQAPLGNVGQVEGASASLVRNNNGISYRIQTEDLNPGNAYTLWLVVINNPEECSTTPCPAPELLGNPAVDAQVGYAAGVVAAGSGKVTMAGSAKIGPLGGWLANRSLEDPHAAEIHLVVNDHGPKIPEFMPGMIKTYRGGCSDASPFPAVFPPIAIGDGEAGPNICRLAQAAVFLP